MPSAYPSDQPEPQVLPLSRAFFLTRLACSVILLNAFVFTLVGLSIHQNHRHYQERAEITTQNLTRTLESEIASALKTGDTALFAVIDEYKKQRANGSIDEKAVNAYIDRVNSRLPEIDGLRITDAQGLLVYGSDVMPDAKTSLADRPHFVRLRDAPQAGLAISKPQMSRANQKWVIALCRRIDQPDGSFGGIAIAAITLKHFSKSFAALDVGPHGSVALRDGELGLIARYPQLQEVASTIGNKPVAGKFREMVAAGNTDGTYTVYSGSDNVERTYSFHKIGSYPLYITVGLATEDYLAEWRNEAANQAALAALFALMTLLAAWLIYRIWKRQVNSLEALVRQETKFHTVADFTFDWEYWQGPQEEILYMTPSCERVTGYTREEFIADPGLLLRVIHPEDRHVMDRHLHDIAHPIDYQDGAQVDFRILRRDGEIRWIDRRCRAVSGRHGEFMGHRVSNRDMSQSKQVEEALLASQRNLAEAQDIAHLGSWELDLVRNRLTWSAEMYRIFGMLPEDFNAAYETFLNDIHPDDRDMVDQAYKSSMNEGGRYEIEYRIIRRSDGQLRWGYARCEHWRDANGKVLRSIGTVQDITERKHLENIAERERIRLQTILRMASDGIHILDTDGILVEANEAFLNMLGYDDSIIGKLRVTDWSQNSWDEIKARINDLTSRHAHEVFETRQQRSDGVILDVEINATVINLEGKNYIYAAARDITKRKQVEAELIAAKQAAETASLAKTRFLAAASHDLRQPLQAIGLFNDALARTELNAIQERISRHLSTSVNSLGELLNRLLDISRLDAYMIKPQPEVIQAEDLLGTLDAEFASLALEKNLRFNLFCPRQGLALFSDANLLLDLLRNLIGNAVKYTEQGGVLVSIRRRGDRALIQVWDTGIGIASEHLDSIFEEYFQVSNPERGRVKGVGLGLAIVRRLSELLGTRVCCRSRLGRGSVFEISLPLTNGTDAHASPVQASATLVVSASARFSRKRIVVIEDDALAAEAIKFSLETHDIRVALFGTAEEALGSSEAMEADYFISDYRLPGMDGLQLLDAIQRVSARPIKAVLLTGDTSPYRIELAHSSRWTVLFKPIDLAKLLSALEP